MRKYLPKINGTRGVILLITAAYCLTRGIAYIPPIIPNPSYVPSPLTLISAIIPLPVWGYAWIVTGLVCIVCSFKRRDGLAWILSIAMMFAWGASYGISSGMDWFSGGAGRQFISAGSYIYPGILATFVAARMPDGVRDNE